MVGDLTAGDFGFTNDDELIDVLDLPQLYTKPDATTLLSTISELRSQPSSWESTPLSGRSRNASGTTTPHDRRRKIKNEGVPAYLTRIVSSTLQWIEDDDQKEQIWENAAQELSIRSGRTAQGDMTRTFNIPLAAPSSEEQLPLTHLNASVDAVELSIHEPALTADNLGFKTWASSYMLAKRLCLLKDTVSTDLVLELGSGTGLVGIAAACVFGTHVMVTDLPEIVPNLKRNVKTNAPTIQHLGGSVTATDLDWNRPDAFHVDGLQQPPRSFQLIVAADVIYSLDHPRILADTIGYHLERASSARLLVELPLRQGYGEEIEVLRRQLLHIGLGIVSEGEETGFDDWSSHDEPVEVQCWWSIWCWTINR